MVLEAAARQRWWRLILSDARMSAARMSEFSSADLSIVIPTRNRWVTLGRTLAALDDQTESGFETIVVVDGAEQGVPSLPGARVIQQEHAGPGAARNRGVEASERALILLLGDDMVPQRDFVARHLAR